MLVKPEDTSVKEGTCIGGGGMSFEVIEDSRGRGIEESEMTRCVDRGAPEFSTHAAPGARGDAFEEADTIEISAFESSREI